MAKYVIGVDAALLLARTRAGVSARHQLLAPTLFRSQLLAHLFGLVRRGELDRNEAGRHLDHVRGLRVRLLGDRVLQRTAWTIADQLGWPDTYAAEYIALAKLQADAFICLDADMSLAASRLVRVASIDELRSGPERTTLAGIEVR